MYECNLDRKEKYSNFIPVIFHNGKNYDFHLILPELIRQKGERKVDIIAINSEKFISFTIGRLRFIDSYNFMSSWLDSLAKLNQIQTKTLYPYEYYKSIDDYDKVLGKIINELTIEDFKSSLHSRLPSQEDVDEFN